LINADANVVAAYAYDPFGNVSEMAGAEAAENPWRFSTKPVEAGTGWLYYGFRWYDAKAGRWVNRDPIEESGGVNLYGFVGNDSISVSDAFGLFPAYYPRVGTAIPGVNCLAHATGIPGSLQIDPGKSHSDALGNLGWACSTVGSSDECVCNCETEMAAMAYTYVKKSALHNDWDNLPPSLQRGLMSSYSDPWNTPWGECDQFSYDSHFIRRNCASLESDEDAWDYIGSHNDDPNTQPSKISNPDEYWSEDNGVRVLGKYCCKKEKE
jgi:RHS repeat-associated protein